MKRVFGALIMLLLAFSTAAGEPAAAIYHPDPAHLWNRLYGAAAMRSEDGMQFGADISEPYWEDFDDPDALIAVLDEFLKANGQNQVRGELPRALLLNDLWAAFDLAATTSNDRLQRRLAQVIGRLKLSAAAIAALPDNYAGAVKAGGFAADFDPQRPGHSFLPPDLFDPRGPWVQIVRAGGGAIAAEHARAMSGRSAFMIFIRCPGGREATLAYLDKLNLFDTPWLLEPAEIGDHDVGSGKRVPIRVSVLTANPETPQPPEGTIVALVRQMVVINDQLEPVVTSITQKVQLRVLQRIEPGVIRYPRERFNDSQSVHEFVMRRRPLLAGEAGGLRAVTADEKEYQRLLRFMGIPRAELLRGPAVLSTCARCHEANGIFALNTYQAALRAGRDNGPTLEPAGENDYHRREVVRWKQQQFDWGLLRGLLAGGQ